MEKKLKVRNLRVSFRTVSGKLQAVRDISFDLEKGETLAIVGESGSGKSVTSKAIIGILAGNAIVEGGEILYDGQDLLKIGEDDFYKIRGDKIAMIFQDPLSSLNPIMRIGKQLTEAMLLKGKARQRACKASFRAKLEYLEKAMCENSPDQAPAVKAKCGVFRRFEMVHIKLEQAYNAAFEAAQEALGEVEHILFLMEKNAFQDARVRLRVVSEFSRRAINPYVVSERAAALKDAANGLTRNLRDQIRRKDYADAMAKLSAIADILKEALAKPRPDFFAMGYYLEKRKGDDTKGDMVARNAVYARFMASDFLDDFVSMVEGGVVCVEKKFVGIRDKVIAELSALLEVVDTIQIDAFRLRAVELCKLVDASINPLELSTDSTARTFSSSIKGYMDAYLEGVRTNAHKVKKYEREKRAHERREAAGKVSGWKVVAPAVVDLSLVKANIASLMRNLMEHYRAKNQGAARGNARAVAEALIDHLKENASGMVLKVTKQAAKNRALKLMDEVGISDPRRRYRQYPFEFSGGMRQRIVIAIALAADPDILICDEPTTALDVTIQAQILELINKLKRERNLSIIFITHDLGVVANMADRIGVMYAGKIVEYGTAEEVFYTPAHPYTWALLSSMPDLETKEKLEAIPGTPPNMIYPPEGDAFAERNRYAMRLDFEREPPAFFVSDTHWAKTWLLHPDAPKVDPPKILMERVAKMKARMEVRSNV